jgi:NADH-quinone oxidoreductase subunit L
VIGWFTLGPVVFGDFLGGSIFVLPANDVVGELAKDWHGPLGFVLHGFATPPLYLALIGAGLAWFLYLKNPALPGELRDRFGVIYRVLVQKYYADTLAEQMIPAGSRALGRFFWRVGDVAVIDGGLVNGTAGLVGRMAGWVRRVQSGYLYHYAFAMILGLVVLVTWLVLEVEVGL